MYSAPQAITSTCKLLYTLNLCDVFVRPDSEVPWMILVPKREALFEVHQLDKNELQLLWSEVDQVSRQIAQLPNVDKLNIATLGNIEPRLHIHIIGRSTTDRAWPKAIWDIPDANDSILKFKLFQQLPDKESTYKHILKQFENLVDPTNSIGNMAILNSLIHENFNHHWIGFYIFDKSADLLKLGPYQGPLPCLTINNGVGVCGSSFKKNQSRRVDDVHQFEGHIACSSYSNSEIVIPFENKILSGVLDIDSINYASFDDLDINYLERIVKLI